jgi:hypothetical protein
MSKFDFCLGRKIPVGVDVWLRVNQSVAYGRVIIACSALGGSCIARSLVSRYAIVYLRYKSNPVSTHFSSIVSFKRARICCVYGYRNNPFF